MPVAEEAAHPQAAARDPASAPDPGDDPVLAVDLRDGVEPGATLDLRDGTVPDAEATADDGAVPDDGAEPYGVAEAPVARGGGFEVHLDNFEGPFDLLLGLISKHKLDVTEISLARVTDEFIGWLRAAGPAWDLDETSEFLLVAATLLDLKAARLLPQADVEDDEDLALLEARDLLFARLLQYRAFKAVAATFAERFAAEAHRMPRAVPVEPRFAELLPELVLGISPDQLATIAARAMTPKAPPVVGLEHLHAAVVSVREQAALIVERLRRTRSASFRALIADADGTVVVVARFLALLELFREGAVSFDQVTPLGELSIRWTGSDDGDVAVTDDFDGAPAGEDGSRDPADGDDPDRADGGRPDGGRPDDGRPDGGRPDDGRPDDGRPGDGRPGDGRPDDGRPDSD